MLQLGGLTNLWAELLYLSTFVFIVSMILHFVLSREVRTVEADGLPERERAVCVRCNRIGALTMIIAAVCACVSALML